MKTGIVILVLLLLSPTVKSQHIRTENEAMLVKKIVDQQTNLQAFVIAPTIFNNKGETFPGKFSCQFFYDTSSSLLVKVVILEVGTGTSSTMYFSNEQLAVVASKKGDHLFFDADFSIPYWGVLQIKKQQ